MEATDAFEEPVVEDRSRSFGAEGMIWRFGYTWQCCRSCMEQAGASLASVLAGLVWKSAGEVYFGIVVVIEVD